MRKFFPAVLLAVFLALTSGPSIAVAEGLFPDEWSRGELEMFKGQADATRKVLGSLSQMERLLLLMQAEKGDCKMALEVESKAKAGDSDAQWKLAWLYKEGACVKKDEKETVRWLYEAAKQGHSEAALELAHAFYEGKGVEKNQYQAAIFMRQSAEAGNARAMIDFSILAINGEGTPLNPTEAISWLEKATEDNQFDTKYQAHSRLGWIYLVGTNIPRDYQKAYKWAAPAADRGFPLALLAAGMAAAGLGNKVEAHKWLNIASTAEVKEITDIAVTERPKVEAKMTPNELTKARRLASNWKPKTQDDDLRAPIKPKTKLPSYDAAKARNMSKKESLATLKKLGVEISKDPYFDAVKTDNLGIFTLFHRAGATLNEGWGMGKVTPLYMATDWGSKKVFDYLIANGAMVDIPDRETGMTPLVRAIAHNRTNMVVALLKAGASAKQSMVIDGKETHLLAGASPLLYAITGKDVDPMLVRYLLRSGASVKEVYQQGRTPLMEAVSAPTEVFRILLEAGADPNAKDNLGETVLHHLVRADIVSIPNLRALLKAGASTEWKSEEFTPLAFAVWIGNAEAVKPMLDAGAKPDLPMRILSNNLPMSLEGLEREIGMNGGTLLMLASTRGHAAVAKELVNAGANPEASIVIGNKRISATSIANESGNPLLMLSIKR